jgi:hypothetical protein
MGAFLATLFGGLGVAAITGLTFLAYKHPSAYEKVFKGLEIVLGIIMLLIMFWSLAVSRAHLNLLPFIDQEKRAAADVAVQSIDLFSWKLFFAYFALYLYLLFLRFLRFLLHEDECQPRKEAGTPCRYHSLTISTYLRMYVVLRETRVTSCACLVCRME